MSTTRRAPAIGAALETERPRTMPKTHRIWGGVCLVLLVFASSPVQRAQAQSGPPGSGWVLTFDDEFNGNSLDLSKWGYVTPYWDWRLAAQSKADPSAVVEGNGVLQLLTYLTDPNGPPTQANTTTGQIWTLNTFSQKYGWFEFRCKMAPGAGMDETCWLLSAYGGTEYQEIDMPEWLGNRPTTLYLAHWFVPPGGNWSGTLTHSTGPDWSADFHTYAVNWQPDSLTYYVDGIQYWQTTDHVPQEPLFLLVTSGSSSGWGGDINASTCPNSMVLDYVRVYQGAGQSPPSPNGSVIRAGQGGSLTTSEGTWTFGGVCPDGVDSYTQLNGVANGWAVELLIANGNLYAFNQVDGDWWLRQNGSWVNVGPTDPAGGTGNLIQDPNYDEQTQGNGNRLITPWSANGPAMTGLDSHNGMNGSPCGFIYDGSGSGAWSAITQTVQVNPNTNYTLSCFVQTDSAFPAQGWMGANAPDGTGLGWISYGQLTNYTQLSVTFNSGSNSSVLVNAGFTDQGAGAWIHADNWSMK